MKTQSQRLVDLCTEVNLPLSTFELAIQHAKEFACWLALWHPDIANKERYEIALLHAQYLETGISTEEDMWADLAEEQRTEMADATRRNGVYKPD